MTSNLNSLVRTRFAPSPTGYIHVGNVRSALYPWLIARQNGGKFIIRIEDTDQARFVSGATEMILDTLNWLRLDWDEGPIIGGAYGPYFQTERREIYHVWAKKLIDKGLAYADPYTKEEVEAFRAEAAGFKQPFLYRHHRPDNPPAWDGSQALRFKVPEIKDYDWHDEVMGELKAGADALDDFILIKADGLPTYNFAHIVDDAEMKVTHVIRGLEYISSMPKYLSLYDALELDYPIFASLPHILSENGQKKLGKRDGAKAVTEYREDGILPEAMINFLAGLGWNDGTTQEIYSIEELISKFSLNRVQRSGARFDEKRLLWMNGQWIRRLELDDLYNRGQKFWGKHGQVADEAYKKEVLKLAQERLKTLKDIPAITECFFYEPVPDWSIVESDKNLQTIDLDTRRNILQSAHDSLAQLTDFSADNIQLCLNDILVKTGQKPAVAFSLIRYALSWAKFSPSLNQMMETLNQGKSLKRLLKAIESV